MDQELRNKLLKAILLTIPLAHCNGCDGCLCEAEEGQDFANAQKVLRAIEAVLASNNAPPVG